MIKRINCKFKRLRVAIASSGLGHVSRGMETWAESLAEALYENRIEVVLFRGAGPPKNAYDLVLPTLKRNKWPAKLLAKITSKGGWRIGLGAPHAVESFIYGTQLLFHLKTNYYDALHVQQGSLALFLHRSQRLGLMKTPFIFGNGQKASPQFINLFPYVQFLSPFDKDNVTKYIKEKPGWFVIPNFVDTDIFFPMDKKESRKKLGLPENHFIILTVGMIDRATKRMDYFVKEAGIFRKKFGLPVHFVVAGAAHQDSPSIIELGKEILGKDITFFLDLPRDKMPSLYSAADVFVLCSFREALGLAVIEAMSCGVPVVCHNFPVLEWVVQQGGQCQDLGREYALANVLLQYSNAPGLIIQQAELARQRVLAEFSKPVVLSKIIEMYKRVIESRN